MASTKTLSQRTLAKITEEESLPAGAPAPAQTVQQPRGDQLRHCFVPADESGCLGLHLSRTPWDPYPWVSGIVEGSCADLAGVRVGDCVLEANGEDLLGLKVVDVAKRVRSRRVSRSTPPGVALLLWNSGFEKNNLNPQSLSRFANCLQGIAGLLECPICLEIIRPPSWQCHHGHLICSGCRSKTTKCPICREALGRGRCIVADKLFHYLVQTLGHDADQRRSPKTPISPGRRLPLMLREYQRQPQQQQQQHPEPHKHASKLKANIGLPGGTPPQLQSPPPPPPPLLSMSSPVTRKSPDEGERLFHCPSGQPCARMKSQHDILIHLQRAHQTSVVQYYVTPGDSVDVALTETGSSLPCVVLLPTTDKTSAEVSDADHLRLSRSNQMFFVTRFRPLEQPSESLYWMWHVGDGPQSGCFRVQFQVTSDDRDRWQGRPVPLAWGCQEALRSKQFVRVGGDARTLCVRIFIASDDRGET